MAANCFDWAVEIMIFIAELILLHTYILYNYRVVLRV